MVSDIMPKWMNKCERCHEVVGGEHVLLIGADGIVKTMYHIPCFLAANLEPGQLSDQVSATWGGKRGRHKSSDLVCSICDKPATCGITDSFEIVENGVIVHEPIEAHLFCEDHKREPEVIKTNMPGKRAILVEDFDSKRWE